MKLDRSIWHWHMRRNSIAGSSHGILFIFIAASATFWHLSHWIIKRTELRKSEPWREFYDNVWPIRQQTPWDISTDFPHPRKLEYDVSEGTWLRLDVHPKSGDIVFDMLGDLFCLPAQAYSAENLADRAMTVAGPILVGVPHDSDPHFSPAGDHLVFRSDAELGIENVWMMEWIGCANMNVRRPDGNDELAAALKLREFEENLLARGVPETPTRRQRRLVREGRSGAQRVTNETYRWVSDPRFHPSGSSIIATKWYTSSRALGSGEGWEYSLSKVGTEIRPGSGKRIVGRSLPLGWGPERYENVQVGAEQLIWNGNDTVIYSQNTADAGGIWTYSKDVHSGVYSIFSYNLTSKRTTKLVDAFPGGATRPELSRDGRTLAFVRRVGDKEVLVLKGLDTGSLHYVWDGLSYDASAVSAPMGSYPSFAFTPDDTAVIIWAAGQIWHVPLSDNDQGERVSGEAPRPIRFIAHVKKHLAETLSPKTNLTAVETADTQRVYAFQELRADEHGRRVVFQAAGATYVQDVAEDAPRARRVPHLDTSAPYYSPSFVPGTGDLVVHSRWSDVDFTTFELANLTSGAAHEISLPLGRYYSPVLCGCSGRHRQLAFVKTGGDYLTGNIIATANPGLYIGDIAFLRGPDKGSSIPVTTVRFIPSEINTADLLNTQIRFLDGHTKLLVQSPRRVFVINLAAGPDDNGDYAHETIATGRMTTELVVSQVHRRATAGWMAFVDFFQVYVAPNVKPDDPVWSKPGKETQGLMRLSVDGGHDATWSMDGQTLLWLIGPTLQHADISKLNACIADAVHDHLTFGISCTKTLVARQEVNVEYQSDIERLKDDAAASLGHVALNSSAILNADMLVIYNASILTMGTGDMHSDSVPNGVLVTRGGVIEVIASVDDYQIPIDATVIDVGGAFVTPGFIDVHAHWNGFATQFPARSWELEAFLAYGITTLHNPAAMNVLGFAERFRVERGQMVGPRIYQTGDVIYGAATGKIHQDIVDVLEIHQDVVDMDEARAALKRIKAEGGPSAFSYKNYNLPSRASRQRLLLAAQELGMLCVPEGGMNYDWDQTYIIDGMTTIEHSLPIPVLYDDILTLFAFSGTGYTPTHIVNYGGAMGEEYIWASGKLADDPKPRRFGRHDILAGVEEATLRPNDSYAVFNTSAAAADMVRRGLRAHIGAHGEPPLGYNFHAEMFFTKRGGLTNYEVLRAATSDAAKTLGINDALGSLSPGKLADFVVYQPGIDLLGGDIDGAMRIRYVARGGRMYCAETMMEEWPVRGRRPVIPLINP